MKHCWRKSGLVGVPGNSNDTDDVLSPADEELQALEDNEEIHPVAEIDLNTLITQLKATKEEESVKNETEIGPKEKIPDALPIATQCLEYCRMIRNRSMASDKPIPDSHAYIIVWTIGELKSCLTASFSVIRIQIKRTLTIIHYQ